MSITMAAASLIKKAGFKPRRSLRVILWANEEQGLKGAFSYAKNNKEKMDSMIVGAESDFGAGRIYRFSSLVETKDLPFIEQMQDMLEPLGIARGNNKATPGPDLIPLYEQGMMVFRLHQDGTDYFDLHHTADDTLDKVDPKALAQNVAAYAVYAMMMAQYQGDLKRPEIAKQKQH
ncbi:MAG: M28 family peptidase [Enterobacterales bacterium]|nr:M28 family peptidase [Enterobacterales bacterium]